MTSSRRGPTAADHPDTLMWEARAVPGRRDALLDWVEQHALREVAAAPGFRSADVYRAGQDRVVTVARFDPGHAPARLPDPPPGILTRPAHQWPFRLLRSV